ncbi:DUF1255 family protein [Vibrio anguillarum]|nr:DUF1255 family protein [Vibrio anguillarum]
MLFTIFWWFILQGREMIKENTYFDGAVKSLGFAHQSGDSSVGVMAAGEYTFGTAAPERMTVIKGSLTIKRLGDEHWSIFKANESFEVAENSSFDLKVAEATAYLCEYL